MKRLSLRFLPLGPLFAMVVGLGSSPSCQPAFPTEIPGRSLSIRITNGDLGTDDRRIGITFSSPAVYTVDVQALDENGALDKSFNGYVRFSIEPGTVLSVASHSATTNGRNAQLVNGVATGVEVSVVGSFGNSRILAEDLGYQPVDPAGVPLPGGGTRPPECANGKDDNHNGLVDYPVDPGCYAANDDTEDGGTYAGASSPVIHFRYPRINDVQGMGTGTPFPNEEVQIDTQWNGTTQSTHEGVVVVGIAATGFFVTDVGWTQGFNSLYGYTYSAPALMNVCDRLISFGGTSANFYGFVEMNYPTWSLEEWDPQARPCLVPEPALIPLASLSSTQSKTMTLSPLEAGLVRVPAAGEKIHVGKFLGKGLVPYATSAAGVVTAGPITAMSGTNCDYLGTGKIDYMNAAEAACATACTDNPECSEYTQYVSQGQFNIVIVGADGTSTGGITANGSASAGFDPIHSLGADLEAFTGVLNYFSGGNQFTIQARCSDDVVFKGGKVLPSSPVWPTPDGGTQEPAACVVNRSIPDMAPSH